MAAEPNRLFFALWPDDATRTALADAARNLHARLQPGGRLEKPERLHATLLFLGDAVPSQEEAAAMQAASLLRADPFTMTLDRAGTFSRNSKLWWLGSSQPSREALALHDALRARLRTAGVSYDLKSFTPHVTFLRDAGKSLAPTPVEPIRWQADDFVLVRSQLHPQPAEYQVIGRWKLDREMAKQSGSAQLDLWENAGKH
jgi:2'-5' RNA ligase